MCVLITIYLLDYLQGLRHCLLGEIVAMLDSLKHVCFDFLLTDARDSINWSLDKEGFYVKSLYFQIRNDGCENMERCILWFV